MKAVIAREPGGPEVLQLVQRPVPSPQPGEAHRLLEANANVGKVVLSVAQ